MEELHNKNGQELILCRVQNENNNRIAQYIDLDNHLDDPLDPLSEPEVTVNLNERSIMVPVQPLEEPEDDLFDYEVDNSMHETPADSEEQVVPSSQLSNSHKYPDDITISDDEIDEGIFEDDQSFPNIEEEAEIDNNHRDNSQPP